MLSRLQSKVLVLTQHFDTLPESSMLSEIRVPAHRPAREWRSFLWLRMQPRDIPVICGVWYPEGLVALLSGASRRVILAHGAELLPPVAKWRRPLWAILQRWVLESADLVVANSEYTRKLVLTVAPNARVEAIPLAVDHERFAPGDRISAKQRLGLVGKQVICTVSRIHRYKGHEVVLRAISQLSPNEHAVLAYLVVGAGPYEEELKKLAVQLGLNSVVRWCGFVSEDDLSLVYRASDLFVLCTQEALAERAVEGFGLVFLEAQACGTAVVGTRTGGICDAVKDGEGGWLIEENDTTALTNILRQLVHSPETVRTAGVQARQRILREFTWDHYMKRFSVAISQAMVEHD
jgi:phosphatidylinositol alpha-1,6-mannosyltransferase